MRADPHWSPDTTAYPSSQKFNDLTGRRFGRLTAMGYAGKKNGKPFFRCLCICGKQTIVMGLNLYAGYTKSCGCLHSERTSKAFRTHGHAGHGRQSTEYRIWQSMWTRCTNPKSISWKWYGARGISVCARWSSFEAFLEDMGVRPSRHLTLDRIENDGNYEPSNCRWATGKEQAATRRRPLSKRKQQ